MGGLSGAPTASSPNLVVDYTGGAQRSRVRGEGTTRAQRWATVKSRRKRIKKLARTSRRHHLRLYVSGLDPALSYGAEVMGANGLA